MNTRRNFLTALAAIPFLGWLKPVEAKTKLTMELQPSELDCYDPSTHTITLRRNAPPLVEPREVGHVINTFTLRRGAKQSDAEPGVLPAGTPIYCDPNGWFAMLKDGTRINLSAD